MITLHFELPNKKEVVELYRSVGWSGYVADPNSLMMALKNRSWVAIARQNGRLSSRCAGESEL